MKLRTAIVALAVAVGLSGCSDKSATKPPVPLSVADWKAMPPDQKYTTETLERLKEGDPKLQTPDGWEAFQKSVVLPARKKDFPSGKTR